MILFTYLLVIATSVRSLFYFSFYSLPDLWVWALTYHQQLGKTWPSQTPVTKDLLYYTKNTAAGRWWCQWTGRYPGKGVALLFQGGHYVYFQIHIKMGSFLLCFLVRSKWQKDNLSNLMWDECRFNSTWNYWSYLSLFIDSIMNVNLFGRLYAKTPLSLFGMQIVTIVTNLRIFASLMKNNV